MKKFLISFLAFATAAVAAEDAKPKEIRAARSVHLGYPAPDATLFYNELIVEESVNGSYFMACGWNTGYFGVQQLGSPANKVVIFSVWDPTKGDNPNAVKAEDRVELLYEGDGVRIKRFGGEGTGGQCMAPFAWRVGETNRFVLRADVQDQKTAYTAWVWRNDRAAWWKLATFRTQTKGSPLKGFHSFVEDFRRDKKSAGDRRRARFGNGWVQSVAGEWTPLTKARFTGSSAEWEAKDTIDAGLADGGFYLATGGETKTSTPLRSIIELPQAQRNPPKLDLNEPRITVDTSEVPELAEWGLKAGKLCEEWHPRISALLASEGFTPPSAVRIVFKKDMKGVAATSGAKISVAADFVKGHTNDFGMIIHELTHVVQSYPPSRAGWLVEGIADYIRLFHFEPNAPRPRINPDKASYRDAYKTAAMFLAWAQERHDKELVKKLNQSLREKKYRDELFKEFTGKTLDELWNEFTESLRKKA
ncbi:MAG: DUF3472 domain-containing protein [Verrucomicrobia bacterium]|nr:DUF3472 domain-containing protein [Verrucomicrobiota bacterium]